MKKYLAISLFIGLLLLVVWHVPFAAGLDGCPTENSWTGDVNTSWEQAGNWSCGVVPSNTNATIPVSASPNFPIVSSPGLIFVNNLTIESGASLDLNGASVIMNGTLVNNGTLIDRRAVESGVSAPETCFFCFGDYQGLYLSRDEGVGSDPGIVEVIIKGNQGTCDTGDSTIGRCFEITPTNRENINLDAIFYFRPEELNDLACERLNMYHRIVNGWEPAGSLVSVDCEDSISPDYSIQVNDISKFSYFVGAPGTPTAANLIQFTPDNGFNEFLMGAVLISFLVLAGAVMALKLRRP